MMPLESTTARKYVSSTDGATSDLIVISLQIMQEILLKRGTASIVFGRRVFDTEVFVQPRSTKGEECYRFLLL